MNQQENQNPRREDMSANQPEQTQEPVNSYNPEPTSETQGEVAGSNVSNGAGRSVMPLIIGAIIVALLMIAGAWYFMSGNGDNASGTGTGTGTGSGTDSLPVEQSAFEFEEGDPNEVVAVVNGTELLRSQFNETRNQIAQTAQQQGLTPETEGAVEQINNQAIETLVNTELILQAAAAAGVTADAGAVDTRMAEIVQSVGGQEQLAQSLEQLGLTEDSLRADLEQEVLIEAYLDTQLGEFTASEEEITALYDQAAAGQELPPLEEIRGQVEQQVVATKRQEAVTQLVETLRAEAEVDVRI